jgi:hypothetical protein
MVVLDDETQAKARSGPFGDGVSVGARMVQFVPNVP